MRRLPNVGLLLAHRLRRWPNNNPTLGKGVGKGAGFFIDGYQV